jgi:heterotetrameric sarcosine oxidase gamma subunit
MSATPLPPNVERKLVKLTAMHHLHLAAGATMVDDAGWLRPARYTDVDDELATLRSSVGICDVSPLAKSSLQGDDLDAAISAAFPDAGAMAVRHVSRQPLPGASDSVVLARLTADEAMVIGPPGTAPQFAEALERPGDDCAHAVDVSSGMAGAAIAGPSAHLVLASVTDLDLSQAEFPDMRCAEGRFADVYGLLLRLDRGGLPGYELYFGRDFGEYMWDALVESAQHYGGGPVGTEAMERLT